MKKYQTHAVCAGSFDPPTKGHEWLIHKGSEIFDSLTVVVGENFSKIPLIYLKDRIKLLKELTLPYDNVTVDYMGDYLLVDYAKYKKAQYLIRSARNIYDFDEETTMNRINSNLSPGLTTILLLPPPRLLDTSSTLVKTVLNHDRWEEILKDHVSPPVLEYFINNSIEINGGKIDG